MLVPRSTRLDAATVGSTAAVVRQRSDIDDLHYLDAGAVDRTHGRLSALTRPLYINLNLTQTHVVSNLGAVGSSRLCSIGSVLLRTAEAHLTGRRPADDLAHLVGDRHDNVVESRVYESHALSTDLDNLFLNCSSFLCHNSPILLSCLFLVCYCLLLTLARASVVLRALTANGKTKTVADTAIATDIHKTLDVELNHRAALALDLDAHLGDHVTDSTDLLVGPVLNLDVVAYAHAIENLARSAAAYTVDIGQAYLAALIFW